MTEPTYLPIDESGSPTRIAPQSDFQKEFLSCVGRKSFRSEVEYDTIALLEAKLFDWSPGTRPIPGPRKFMRVRAWVNNCMALARKLNQGKAPVVVFQFHNLIKYISNQDKFFKWVAYCERDTPPEENRSTDDGNDEWTEIRS